MNFEETIIFLAMIKVFILLLISFGTTVYVTTIGFVRRFQKLIYLSTWNFSLAALICSIFWIFFFVMNTFFAEILFNENSCLTVIYLQTVVNCQVLYSLCVVSVHRVCRILLPTREFFRKKSSLSIFIFVQWSFGFLLPLVNYCSSVEVKSEDRLSFLVDKLFLFVFQHCLISGLEMIYQLYTLFIIGVVPGVLFLTTNILLFIVNRRSLNQIAPFDRRQTRRTREINVNFRDDRLLKHTIFMFVVFFCAWIPIYIIAVINWNGRAISYVLHHCLTILPTLSLFIDVSNLFFYNQQLTKFIKRTIRTCFSVISTCDWWKRNATIDLDFHLRDPLIYVNLLDSLWIIETLFWFSLGTVKKTAFFTVEFVVKIFIDQNKFKTSTIDERKENFSLFCFVFSTSFSDEENRFSQSWIQSSSIIVAKSSSKGKNQWKRSSFCTSDFYRPPENEKKEKREEIKSNESENQSSSTFHFETKSTLLFPLLKKRKQIFVLTFDLRIRTDLFCSRERRTPPLSIHHYHRQIDSNIVILQDFPFPLSLLFPLQKNQRTQHSQTRMTKSNPIPSQKSSIRLFLLIKREKEEKI